MSDMIAFKKVTEAPVAPFDPNTIYMVTTGVRPDDFEIYVSNAGGTAAKNTLSRTAVDNLIAAAFGNYDSGVIVADFAALNAMNPTKYTQALVIDATGDATVSSGAATYVYSVAQTKWIKISEAESMDVIPKWDLIQDRPEASVTAIDAAATYIGANATGLTTLLDWFASAQAGVDAASTWVAGHGATVLTDIATLKTTTAEHTTQISQINTDAQNLSQRVTDAEGRITTQEETNAVQQASLTNHTSRLVSLETAAANSLTFQGNFSEDGEGRLLYKGNYPTAALAEAAW